MARDNMKSLKTHEKLDTLLSCRYGFLLFNSHEAANFVLTQLNGKLIPGADSEDWDIPFCSHWFTEQIKVLCHARRRNNWQTMPITLCPLPTRPVQSAGTDQVFRLNWAANGRQGIAGPSDYSLFVGDLTEEVTDYMLQEAFRRYYPSVRSAKVWSAQFEI